MKLCKTCGLEKPETEFHKDRSKPDGLNAYCKPCQRERQRTFDMRPPRFPAPEGMKRCQTCKTTKPLAEFYADRRQYDGRAPRCKACQTVRFRKWEDQNRSKRATDSRKRYAANPDRFKDYERKRRYGLSPGEYDRILADQGNCCAICGSTKPGAGRKCFHVDHDHDTKQIRGLLCHSCNLMLGNSRDSIDTLSKAVDYLTSAKSASRRGA